MHKFWVKFTSKDKAKKTKHYNVMANCMVMSSVYCPNDCGKKPNKMNPYK